MTEGVAVVAPEPELECNSECEALLVSWELNARAELSGKPPPFSCAAATWALKLFYQACRFVSYRDVAEAEIVRELQARCPERRSPSVDWSVDLIFRQLPTLYRLAQHLSEGDPLVRELMSLARQWPLSSVGVTLAEPAELDSFLEHPALRQLYVDRIFEYKDGSRLGDRRVDAVVRAGLGAYPGLCLALARKLGVEAAGAAL